MWYELSSFYWTEFIRGELFLQYLFSFLYNRGTFHFVLQITLFDRGLIWL